MRHPGVQIAAAFWNICLLRYSPQDIPASRLLFYLTLLLHWLCTLSIFWIGFPLARAVVLSTATSLLMLFVVSAILFIKGKLGRFWQTSTALMGSLVVLYAPSYGLRYWFFLIESAGTESNVPGYLWIFFFVWKLFIAAHIFRHALDTRLFAGFVVAISYVLLEFQVLYFLHRNLVPLVT